MKTRDRELVLFHVLVGHGAVVMEIGQVLHGRILLGLSIGRQTLSENLGAGGQRMGGDGLNITRQEQSS